MVCVILTDAIAVMFALVESHDDNCHQISIRAIEAFLGQSRDIMRRGGSDCQVLRRPKGICAAVERPRWDGRIVNGMCKGEMEQDAITRHCS